MHLSIISDTVRVAGRASWAIAFCLLLAGGLQAAALPEVAGSGISVGLKPIEADPWAAVGMALAAHREAGAPGPGSGLVDMAHEALRFAQELTSASDSHAKPHAAPSDWLQLAPDRIAGVDEARFWLDALLGTDAAFGGGDGSFDFNDPLTKQAMQGRLPNEQWASATARLPTGLQNPADSLAMLEASPFLSPAETEKDYALENLSHLLRFLNPTDGSAAPLPPIREFASLTAAVETLYNWYGETADPDELERLADVPALQAEPLARIIAAHMLQAEVTRTAFAGFKSEAAPSKAVLSRVALASMVAAVTIQSAAVDIYCDSAGPMEYSSSIFQFDMSCEDSHYIHDAALVVDLGGNDRYSNNAGAASGSAATLIDTSGNDVYDAAFTASTHTIGSASLGSGLLIDISGNDSYAADGGIAAIGASASAGVGIVLDFAGDDEYVATVGLAAIAASQAGIGVLYDGAGDDEYNATITLSGISASIGAATVGGVGILFDRSGQDNYTAFYSDAAIGAAYLGGSGILIDDSGNDRYAATARTTAVGSAWYGFGAVIDRAGNDTYAGSGIFAVATGYTGVGMVIDESGNDRYAATAEEAAIGAGYLGIGILMEGGGNDEYSAKAGKAAIGAGYAYRGVGILIDEAGNDIYNGTATGERGATIGAADRGWGLLIDQSGNDEYSGSAAFVMGAAVEGLGAVLDRSGNNSYVSGPGGLAQGAALAGGFGLLLDHGTDTTLHLRPGTMGQGVGLLGTGLLIRNNPEGLTRYVVDPGAIQGQQGAAGIGMQIDVGAIASDSTLPTLECPGDAYLDEEVDLGTIDWKLRVCSPDDSTDEQLQEPCVELDVASPCNGDPLTIGSGPEGTATKPVIPCSSIPGCPAIAELLPGDGWSDWLEREYVSLTVNGGLSVSYRTYVDSPTSLLLSTATPAKGDDLPWCDPACTQVT